MPPSAGPSSPTPFHTTWLSAIADGMRSVPTRRGVIAERVGLSIVDTSARIAAAR